MLYKAAVALSRLLGVNPPRMLRSVRAIPFVVADLIRYVRRSPPGGKFPVKLAELYPCYGDRFATAGVAKGHYFHQDLWAARRIFLENPATHVDIGSRVDGFVSHLLVFREVTVVDVRPLRSDVPGLTFVQGDVTRLQFGDHSLESVSCLHAIEHIGLGRYGDAIDYDGWRRGLKELERVLRPGGRLYLGVPIGRERLCFNAHRVFEPQTIRQALAGLELETFSYVDDGGRLHEGRIDFQGLPILKFGCGLFEFLRAT